MSLSSFPIILFSSNITQGLKVRSFLSKGGILHDGIGASKLMVYQDILPLGVVKVIFLVKFIIKPYASASILLSHVLSPITQPNRRNCLPTMRAALRVSDNRYPLSNGAPSRHPPAPPDSPIAHAPVRARTFVPLRAVPTTRDFASVDAGWAGGGHRPCRLCDLLACILLVLHLICSILSLPDQ